jgi:hypothetical protein
MGKPGSHYGQNRYCLWPARSIEFERPQGRYVSFQVLSGCLDSLGGPTARVLQPLETPSCQNLAPVPTSWWLPTTGKRLEHLWIDQTANDAAIVVTHMWDQQILLPLPHVAAGLPCLPTRMMGFQRLRLYRQFRLHMVANHGADWSQQLTILRAQLRPTIEQLQRIGGGPPGQ